MRASSPLYSNWRTAIAPIWRAFEGVGRSAGSAQMDANAFGHGDNVQVRIAEPGSFASYIKGKIESPVSDRAIPGPKSGIWTPGDPGQVIIGVVLEW